MSYDEFLQHLGDWLRIAYPESYHNGDKFKPIFAWYPMNQSEENPKVQNSDGAGYFKIIDRSTTQVVQFSQSYDPIGGNIVYEPSNSTKITCLIKVEGYTSPTTLINDITEPNPNYKNPYDILESVRLYFNIPSTTIFFGERGIGAAGCDVVKNVGEVFNARYKRIFTMLMYFNVVSTGTFTTEAIRNFDFTGKLNT